MLRSTILGAVVGALLALAPVGAVFANTSPNGPGQPGAPNTTCQNFPTPPGASQIARGAPFNPNGTAGTHYAGNPGTASLAHAQSTHAVSQYDIACFQQTSH